MINKGAMHALLKTRSRSAPRSGSESGVKLPTFLWAGGCQSAVEVKQGVLGGRSPPQEGRGSGRGSPPPSEPHHGMSHGVTYITRVDLTKFGNSGIRSMRPCVTSPEFRSLIHEIRVRGPATAGRPVLVAEPPGGFLQLPAAERCEEVCETLCRDARQSL